VEGQHFAAGPWFTVQENGSDWQPLDTAWLSDGAHQTRVTVEIKLALEDPKDVN
jgi:hypothetical protein